MFMDLAAVTKVRRLLGLPSTLTKQEGKKMWRWGYMYTQRRRKQLENASYILTT